MSAPTLDNDITVDSHHCVRAARISFCDRDDADMFLEWLRVRSDNLGTEVTFPLFVCTAADAYTVSSALTCAVFGDTRIADLPAQVAASVDAASLPAVLGPFDEPTGCEVVFAISRR